MGCRCDEITCTELEAALVALKQTSGEAKVRSLVSQLDPDHDGNINLQEVAVVMTFALTLLLTSCRLCCVHTYILAVTLKGPSVHIQTSPLGDFPAQLSLLYQPS